MIAIFKNVQVAFSKKAHGIGEIDDVLCQMLCCKFIYHNHLGLFCACTVGNKTFFIRFFCIGIRNSSADEM